MNDSPEIFNYQLHPDINAVMGKMGGDDLADFGSIITQVLVNYGNWTI